MKSGHQSSIEHLCLYHHFGLVPVLLWRSGPLVVSAKHRLVHSCSMICTNLGSQGGWNKEKGTILSKLTSLQAAQFQILLNFASFTQDSPPTQPQQDHTHQNIALCCCLRTHLLQHTVKEKDIWAMNFLNLSQIQVLGGKKIYRAESDSMRHNRNDHSGQCLLLPNLCFLFTTALRYHLHHPVPAKVHPWPRRYPHQKVLHSKHSHGKKWKKLHYILEITLHS